MDIETAYNEALDYLYSHVDYSLKKASELARADFNLERMKTFMGLLGNPHEKYPVLHVAGTKGKGSTCALMASALTAAGYRTGLYTSPHLQDYCERIQTDGKPIQHIQLVDLVERVKPLVEKVPKLTTFEITTAIGLLHFYEENVDAAVIEVGLGGRLDATNVVMPRVAVITSLSYDHVAVLGNTLAAISGEKAGIIKSGIPVVSAPQVDEARFVLEITAAERHAPLTLVGRDVILGSRRGSLAGQEIRIIDNRAGRLKPVILRIPLLGEHQAVNAAVAYTALRVSGLKVSERAIRDGFDRVKWPCRFEILPGKPTVILDSAHNLDSFRKLDETLEETFPGKKFILIFGASEDKDMASMLKTLKNRLSLILATKADHPRALEGKRIVETAKQIGIEAEAVMPVEAALVWAEELATFNDTLVLSAGSMFVTAEVKTAWEKIHNYQGRS